MLMDEGSGFVINHEDTGQFYDGYVLLVTVHSSIYRSVLLFHVFPPFVVVRRYLCLKDKTVPGEVHVIFKRESLTGQPIRLRDVASGGNVAIQIVSARNDKLPLTTLTVHKKSSSAVKGGYLMCDHAGSNLGFDIKVRFKGLLLFLASPVASLSSDISARFIYGNSDHVRMLFTCVGVGI